MLINAFPVHGLRPDGECNEDKIQLVPGSMQGAKCNGLTLDIVNGKLVGRGANKTCSDQDLVGASFEVRSYKTSERIEITEVTQYTAQNGETMQAFRMESTKETDTANGKRKQLCAKEGQKLRIRLGIDAMKFSDDLPDDAELVIPVVSEMYDETGKAVPINPSWQDNTKAEWNHLACVADALAKRSINHQLTPDPVFSRAALRMWTADYCGGRPFTLRGKMIDWGKNSSFIVESQWAENGAKCLTKPRIIMENGQEVAPSHTGRLLDTFCSASGKDCKLPQTWIDEAKHCAKDNNASQRVEELANCGSCAAPGCILESRNPK